MNKQLSMTPDAIRKREKRAQEKQAAGETMQQICNDMDSMVVAHKPEQAAPQAVFTVLKVGHALVKGKGTAKPKKDSCWGYGVFDGVIVKFFGRRGSAMRYKTEPLSNMAAVEALYAQKLAGTDAKKLRHTDLSAEQQIELLGENWFADLVEKYKKALSEGKVDVYVVPLSDRPWPWPKSPV